MTKPKEPSKATMKAWYDAAARWLHNRTPRNEGANTSAARIIQRHVDREVRKAVKRQAEVVKCAEKFYDAVNTLNANWPDSDCDRMTRYVNAANRAQAKLIAAVDAMKKGKK